MGFGFGNKVRVGGWLFWGLGFEKRDVQGLVVIDIFQCQVELFCEWKCQFWFNSSFSNSFISFLIACISKFNMEAQIVVYSFALGFGHVIDFFNRWQWERLGEEMLMLMMMLMLGWTWKGYDIDCFLVGVWNEKRWLFFDGGDQNNGFVIRRNFYPCLLNNI